MERITRWVVFALLLTAPFGATPHAAAAAYTAASCNWSDVNAVINGPTHTVVNGDIIQIPAGSCTWTSGITVSVGITIRGAGTGNTSASVMGASASCTSTTLTDNITFPAAAMFIVQPTVSSSPFRLSCLKIAAQGGLGANLLYSPIAAQGTCNSTTCSQIRFDNITFDSSFQRLIANSQTLLVTDNVFGVLDHNTVTAGSNSATPFEFINYNNSAWNGVGAYGDNSWTSANSFGTAKTLYLENNSFGAGLIIGEAESAVPNGGEGGGRIAARFNTCDGCFSGVSNHGTDSNGRPRGGRQVEFYGNSYICTNTSAGCQGGVPVRSGVNIMFGNSLTAGVGSWFNAYMNLGAFRAAVIWGPPWNQCNGSAPYDNNSVSPPICIDQPGRSGGTLLSGWSPTPTGWVNQVVDPSYEWNDSGYNPVFGNVSSSYAGMIANRDWYTDNSHGSPQQQTSQTSPFNGSSGVGFGTLARRPTTCTPRVGYWATDQGNWNQSGNSFGQGNLYVCTATNTWTLYYTPYTYPHPLISGSATVPPSAPTNLRVIQ
jgi:hypothetical protein